MCRTRQGTSTFDLVKVEKDKGVDMKKKSSKTVEKGKALVPYVNAYIKEDTKLQRNF